METERLMVESGEVEVYMVVCYVIGLIEPSGCSVLDDATKTPQQTTTERNEQYTISPENTHSR